MAERKRVESARGRVVAERGRVVSSHHLLQRLAELQGTYVVSKGVCAAVGKGACVVGKGAVCCG